LADAVAAVGAWLWRGGTWDSSALRSEQDWTELADLLDDHALLPSLHLAAPHAVPSSLPPSMGGPLERAYLAALARSRRLVTQAAAIAAAAAKAGIDLVVLKGVSALLWLYDDPGIRVVSDVDLMIRPERLRDMHALMLDLGYEMNSHTSLADAEVGANGYAVNFIRDDCADVDLHVQLPGQAGRCAASRAVWEAAAPALGGGAGQRLNARHSLLTSASHFAMHSRELPPASLKDLVDIGMLVARHVPAAEMAIAVSEADAWGVADDLRLVDEAMRTVFGLPVLPASAASPSRLDRASYVFSRRDHTSSPLQAEAVPNIYWKRLSGVRKVGGLGARVEYLWRMAFPAAPNMRRRYGRAAGQSLLWPYVHHFGRIVLRLAAGVAARAIARARPRRGAP
ncbi:MAG: nucleotidyltransferase family protein, partial [Armatimonadetes bacterium]|nr:nucleotidyltransferase family protein [Armatimonadota bacterium]